MLGFASVFASVGWAQGVADAGAPRPPADPRTPSIIPHTLEGRADCVGCHGPAGKKPFPWDHQGRPSAACLSCHVPAESPRAGVPDTPAVPHVTNDYCLSCHNKQGATMRLPGGEDLSIFVDRSAYARSTHGSRQMSCTACHGAAYEKHPHPAFTGSTPRTINRKIVQERCATCHAEVFKQYKESVHGKALVEEGNLDVPSCTDCHGVHTIRDPRTLLFRMDSTDTCSKCHADAALMGKYKISPDVTKTYLADFHGTTVRLDRKQGNLDIGSYKAVCYDCHGIHDIKKANDPDSRVVKGKLVEACRRCHPGASDNFPAAWTAHYTPDRDRWPVVYWINVFYKLAIPGILGGMGLYIVLELFHALRTRVSRWRQS